MSLYRGRKAKLVCAVSWCFGRGLTLRLWEPGYKSGRCVTVLSFWPSVLPSGVGIEVLGPSLRIKFVSVMIIMC